MEFDLKLLDELDDAISERSVQRLHTTTTTRGGSEENAL